MICFNPDDENEDQPVLPIFSVASTVLNLPNQEPIRIQIYTQDEAKNVSLMHRIPAQIRSGTLQYVFKESLLAQLSKYQKDSQFKLISGFIYPNSLTQLKQVQLFSEKLLDESKVAVFETHILGRLILLNKKTLLGEKQFKDFMIPFNIVTDYQITHEPKVVIDSYGNISSSLACLIYNKDINCQRDIIQQMPEIVQAKVITQQQLQEFVSLNQYNQKIQIVSTEESEEDFENINNIQDIVDYINFFVPKRPIRNTLEASQNVMAQVINVRVESQQSQQLDSKSTCNEKDQNLVQSNLKDQSLNTPSIENLWLSRYTIQEESQFYNIGEHQIVMNNQNQNITFNLITDEYQNYLRDIIRLPINLHYSKMRRISFYEFNISVTKRRSSHLYKQIIGAVVPLDLDSQDKLQKMSQNLEEKSQILSFHNHGINSISFFPKNQLGQLNEFCRIEFEVDSQLCFLIEQVYGIDVSYVRILPFDQRQSLSHKDKNQK